MASQHSTSEALNRIKKLCYFVSHESNTLLENLESSDRSGRVLQIRGQAPSETSDSSPDLYVARNDSSPGLEEEAFKTGEVTIETPNQT